MAWGTRRVWRRIVLTLVTGICVIGATIWLWVIPSLIRSQIEAATGGKASIQGWWISQTSSGLTGLVIHEGPKSSSPVRFKADRVTTDVSLQSLIGRRSTPQLVQISEPELTLRFDIDGKPIALPQSKTSTTGSVPKVVITGGKLTIQQEGKLELAFDRFDGSITPTNTELKISATAAGPRFGTWDGLGTLSTDFTKGQVTLTQRHPVQIDADILKQLPFVPTQVAEQVQVSGLIKGQLRFDLPGKSGEPAEVGVGVVMEIGPGADVKLPTLDLHAAHAQGHVKIERGVVDLTSFQGESLGGQLAGTGRISFATLPPRFGVHVTFQGIDVSSTPPTWKLQELGATGRLSGEAKVQLIQRLDGLDFTGSSGSGEISGGTLQGIPVKSFKIQMQGDGDTFKYNSKNDSTTTARPGTLSKASEAHSSVVLTSFQEPVALGLRPLTTQLELEDVDLAEIIHRAEKLTGLVIPVPITGRLSLRADATIPVGTLRKLDAYAFHGEAKLVSAKIAGVHLGRLETKLDLDRGVLALSDFRGILIERSNVQGEGAADSLPMVPAKGKLPAGGFRGTLRAELASEGVLEARFEGEQLPVHELTTPFLVGLSPFRGTTSIQLAVRSEMAKLSDPEAWHLEGKIASTSVDFGEQSTSALEAGFAFQSRKLTVRNLKGNLKQRPLGGHIDIDARFPVEPAQPITVVAHLVGTNTASLAHLVPEGRLDLSGIADGVATLTTSRDGSDWHGNLVLKAPNLSIHGREAQSVQVQIERLGHDLHYELTGETLGGKVKVAGGFPIDAFKGGVRHQSLDAEIRAVGFPVARLLPIVLSQALASKITGEAAIAANVRLDPQGKILLTGIGEVRQLQYGPHYPLGTLKGEFRLSPNGWSVNPFEGELFGGPIEGKAWSESLPLGVEKLDFDLKVERASLTKLLAFLPEVAENISGTGSVRINGRMGPAFRANVEVFVPHAKVAGIGLTELRIPAEVTLSPSRSNGQLHIRHWTARIAGGKLLGDVVLRLGEDHAYTGTVRLSDLDLEPIAQLTTDSRRPASGRLSGKLTFQGPDPALISRFRGRLSLTLADASLVDLPVFREIDKFLGSSRGGLFESGTLDAAIADRVITIESMALSGRLAQIHVTGTVGFTGQLNMEVLVNTREIIPQTGNALISLIPGLREALGRQAEETSKVSSYLSNRLLKLRVSGSLRSPNVNLDPGVAMTDAAVGFFGSVLKMPLSLVPGRSKVD